MGPCCALGNASLWLGLQDGSVTKALADSIPVTFEATLPMHIAGCALPSSSEPSTLLTALYQETAGPDYLLLYEAPPPYTHWKVRSRVTPAGQVGNENWMVRLPDGRLVLVMRDFAPSALGITVSSTDGHTWYLLLSPPIPLRLALPKWVATDLLRCDLTPLCFQVQHHSDARQGWRPNPPPRRAKALPAPQRRARAVVRPRGLLPLDATAGGADAGKTQRFRERFTR